jgi:hypothetical protein
MTDCRPPALCNVWKPNLHARRRDNTLTCRMGKAHANFTPVRLALSICSRCSSQVRQSLRVQPVCGQFVGARWSGVARCPKPTRSTPEGTQGMMPTGMVPSPPVSKKRTKGGASSEHARSCWPPRRNELQRMLDRPAGPNPAARAELRRKRHMLQCEPHTRRLPPPLQEYTPATSLSRRYPRSSIW